MKAKIKGFTLIELIIAIGIMAVLTTIVLANYHNADRTRRTQLASDVVLSALRDGQNDSLSGKQAADCVSPNPYLVRFFYSLHTITVGCHASSFQSYDLPDKTDLRYPGITLTQNGSQVDISSSPGLLVLFYPPFGSVKYCLPRPSSNSDCNSSPASFDSISMTLESSDGSVNYFVTIDGVSGKIEESSQPKAGTASTTQAPRVN